MSKKIKREIEVMLERFYFVKWDRYVYDRATNHYSIYGWIDRKKDKYKDFIEVGYSPTENDWDFTTSSADRHEQICEVMGIEDEGSNHCIRVEKSFDVSNSIKLKKKMI